MSDIDNIFEKFRTLFSTRSDGIPKRIPIARRENYYTKNIGCYEDGKQFMGFVVADFAADMPKPMPANWQAYKRWYAVLHKFAPDGCHIGTDYWFAGTTADGEQSVTSRAKAKLDEYIHALGPVEFKDVAVCLFQVTIDGNLFGLIELETGKTVQLRPNDFVFFSPWNGHFDT